MSRLFYHTMQDNLGNLLFGVTGTMRLAGSGTLATIYGDDALSVILPNPMTNHPSFGSFKCYLGAGAYDFYMAKSGYTFETLTGVQGAGTLAQQDASSVTVTQLGVGAPPSPGYELTIAGDVVQSGGNVGLGGTPAFPLDVYGQARFNSAVAFGGLSPDPAYSMKIGGGMVWHNNTMGLQVAPQTTIALNMGVSKSTQSGIWMKALENDAGANAMMLFANVAGTSVGSITTTASTTAFNTASDARLKEFIETLFGALDVVRALRPVSFRWQADGSKGNGFLAHELMETIPEAVSGLPDEVNADGSVKPQQVDHSRLVPWLTAALQETLDAVELLTARVAALEGAILWSPR